MEIIELDREHYNLIENMWVRLNRLHGALSKNFKDHFDTFTFEKRMNPLLKKEHLAFFVAVINSEHVGYCIVSAEDGKGEIDSIYIEPDYRKQRIGSSLIKRAKGWFNTIGCDSVSIIVADGNDSVLGFYKSFGFHKYAVILKNKGTTN